eukprot:TRINITY_DN39773_c0_g1_i1.p1 TRINITY_DN39773_c0_g1~~TRINITY_DN39773_c0_g1_i1.p1  ORF type:complete len:429 (+),score=69.21 TRINITY_DN39773_c0_g1_i1:178-1464(+)
MEIRDTPARGKAVFATKAFQKGDVVFREAPVFVRVAESFLPQPPWLGAALRRILRETGDPPDAGDCVWDFVSSFAGASEAARAGVLKLFHPPLEDGAQKVKQALRMVELCWKALHETARPDALPSLQDVQRAMLVDLYNNFDGALFSVGCRLNHACAPTIQHYDYGIATLGGEEFRVAFACWNEQLDYLAGVSSELAPLDGKVHGKIAFALGNQGPPFRPLARLAKEAEAKGALALLVTSPPLPLERAMCSRWAQPGSRDECPRIHAFVAESLPPKALAAPSGQLRFVARPSAGKEFRALRDIGAGEELCISYLGPGPPPSLAQRQAYLFGAYGFRCQCVLCGAPPSARPAARRRVGARVAAPRRGLRGSLGRLSRLKRLHRALRLKRPRARGRGVDGASAAAKSKKKKRTEEPRQGKRMRTRRAQKY